MSIEDLPDELLVEIFERVPAAHKMYNISKRFSNIVTDIKRRVHEKPEKYIKGLSDPVSFLLQDRKYYTAIWNKAVTKGNLYLIVEISKKWYRFDAGEEMRKSAKGEHKDLVNFFY